MLMPFATDAPFARGRCSKPIIKLSLACLLPLAACGSQPGGSLAMHDAWARETVAGVPTSAGYGRIENRTSQTVRLVGAETPVAGRIEFHNVITENGVMRMRPLTEGLEVPAGGSVELRPGSYHMMLLELRSPLRSGETLPVTLRFDRGEPLRVAFTVHAASGAPHGGSHE